MDTDYTEALGPICVSLTNLVERQQFSRDAVDSAESPSKNGGLQSCAGCGVWAGGQLPSLYQTLILSSTCIPRFHFYFLYPDATFGVLVSS